MTTVHRPKKQTLYCPGCGLYPHTHNWAHRPDCTAEQISDSEALMNVAAVFSPHLKPQLAAELQHLEADR